MLELLSIASRPSQLAGMSLMTLFLLWAFQLGVTTSVTFNPRTHLLAFVHYRFDVGLLPEG